MTHTKGPWVVSDETLYGTDFGYTVPLMDLGFYEDNERHQEDANLIAAAPELLDALKMAVLWLEYDGKYDVLGMKAAIAKAEGKA